MDSIYQTNSQFRRLSIHMITLYMPGRRLTQSRYAHQMNVEHVGDSIDQLEEQALTHLSQMVWHFFINIGIGCLVHWYISTGLLLYEEFSQDWFFPGEA